jgi:hypothetical protein
LNGTHIRWRLLHKSKQNMFRQGIPIMCEKLLFRGYK